MKIHCDGVTIDVEAEYKKRGFDTLPLTPTMTASDIRQLADRPASYQVWVGMTPLKDAEAVPLTDGMKFSCVPPATY
jgi:hypothetical protein